MPTLSYPHGAVIERLKGAQNIKLLGIAADLAAALNTPPRTTPAVFAVFSTRGGPIQFSGPPIQQDRTTTIALVVWVSNHGAAEVVRQLMDNVLGDIDSRFAGWSPGDPPFGELVFMAARDEFSHGQYLVCQATYSSNWNFSAQRQP